MIQNIESHLKQLRLQAGFNTVEEAAKALKISPSYLYKLEEYQRTISVKQALKMKEVYKCTLEDIIKPYADR